MGKINVYDKIMIENH